MFVFCRKIQWMNEWMNELLSWLVRKKKKKFTEYLSKWAFFIEIFIVIIGYNEIITKLSIYECETILLFYSVLCFYFFFVQKAHDDEPDQIIIIWSRIFFLFCFRTIYYSSTNLFDKCSFIIFCGCVCVYECLCWVNI